MRKKNSLGNSLLLLLSSSFTPVSPDSALQQNSRLIRRLASTPNPRYNLLLDFLPTLLFTSLPFSPHRLDSHDDMSGSRKKLVPSSDEDEEVDQLASSSEEASSSNKVSSSLLSPYKPWVAQLTLMDRVRNDQPRKVRRNQPRTR